MTYIFIITQYRRYYKKNFVIYEKYKITERRVNTARFKCVSIYSFA